LPIRQDHWAAGAALEIWARFSGQLTSQLCDERLAIDAMAESLQSPTAWASEADVAKDFLFRQWHFPIKLGYAQFSSFPEGRSTAPLLLNKPQN
jgi:hypothetical protein